MRFLIVYLVAFLTFGPLKISDARGLPQNSDTTKLETEIDLLVYKLYGLEYDEVKIVDPQFEMNEAEYDRLHFDFEDEISFESDHKRKQIA